MSDTPGDAPPGTGLGTRPPVKPPRNRRDERRDLWPDDPEGKAEGLMAGEGAVTEDVPRVDHR